MTLPSCVFLKKSTYLGWSCFFTSEAGYFQNQILADRYLNIGRATSILVIDQTRKIDPRPDLRSKINVDLDRAIMSRRLNTKGGPSVFESSYRDRPKGSSYNQALFAASNLRP